MTVHDDMPVLYLAGAKISEALPKIIAPIDMLGSDLIHLCPICGIVRVYRGGETVFSKEHDCEFPPNLNSEFHGYGCTHGHRQWRSTYSMTKIRPEPTSDPASTVKTLNKIKIKTESATGSIADLEHWKPLSYMEIAPRAGFIGWLGRKLGIKRWGWIERSGIQQDLFNPLPEELDSLDPDHHYH